MTLLAVVKGCMGLSISTGSVSWRRTAFSWSTAMTVSGALTTCTMSQVSVGITPSSRTGVCTDDVTPLLY